MWPQLNPITKSLSIVFTVWIITLCMAGCSQTKETEPEKNRIETATDSATKAVVKKIRTPLSKAQDTQNLGNKRLEEMDKAMKKY